MNEIEYEQYQEAVQRFYTKEGVNRLPSPIDDPFFSWRACDCCGRSLGGMRYECGPYKVCVDCLYYTTYGKLDDLTMLGISKGGDR